MLVFFLFQTRFFEFNFRPLVSQVSVMRERKDWASLGTMPGEVFFPLDGDEAPLCPSVAHRTWGKVDNPPPRGLRPRKL
jgi:hypothetical protein